MKTTDSSIIQLDFSEEMRNSYRDYAVSVIIARALPDIRDGLKPVQRRILYAMKELGLAPDKPHRKSARIVGDTMGKYHPHGDSSIYDALVHMTEDFSLSIPLVDGHGNFGSIDGDSAAAMRYTEARLSSGAMTMLDNLDKGLVPFGPNFDESEKEPLVLPATLPNLLLNGTTGIAVGMATNIPPHNPSEVIDGVIAYMDDPDISTYELMQYIKGPDFPTGAIITNADDIRTIYETGEGKLKLRARTEIEDSDYGRKNIVITEIPYTVAGNKQKLLESLVTLTKDKVFDEIYDVRDESSKEGIRLVVEVKKDRNVENLLNGLYKKTALEDTYGVNFLAVKDKQPFTFTLKGVIDEFVHFQEELYTKEYEHLLAKAKDRQEIVTGLIVATDVIDLIIEILRGSKNQKQVKECLVNGVTEGIRFKTKASEKAAKKLCFTQRQATAILEMRLYKLIGLEIEALVAEHEETLKNIARYEEILNNYDAMAQVIMEDLDHIKKTYGRKRRTVIENREEAVFEEKKVEEAEVCFLMDRFGYAKVLDKNTYERNKETVHGEYKYVFTCMNTDKICLFTNKGQMHTVKVMDLPLTRLRDKGVPIDNLSNFSSAQEELLCVSNMEAVKNASLIFVTKSGMIKQVPGTEFDVIKRTIASTKLTEEDELVLVELCDTMDYVVLQSHAGYFLRFLKEEVPEKKKAALGVRAMKMGDRDYLEHAYLLESRMEYQIEYKEKQMVLNKIKLGKRDTKGTKVRV